MARPIRIAIIDSDDHTGDMLSRNISHPISTCLETTCATASFQCPQPSRSN